MASTNGRTSTGSLQRKPATRSAKPVQESQILDEFAGYEDSPENDWIPDQGDPMLATLAREMFSTKTGKLRKAVLSRKQAVALARAYAFAAMYNVPELAALCDMLSDTTVSVNGKGLNQLVQVMTARMQAQDDANGGTQRLLRNLG